ncbi:helix-turn-helix transcriptional regulator [Paenibacillus humicola]|uniref:helix-turn-helix transcriptional regulator n=1 Tax=Paenibacillus humicola TaxID=3110540 RepID=UPI00237AA8AF|nr:helix-turn-helix transcriptional regulator [Paenibacillus humicola]
MENLVFRAFTPHPRLQPYIASIFALETRTGLLKNNFNMIAPNGKIKLVIPYKNNMRSTIGGFNREHREASCFVIGLTAQPALIDSDREYGNLCVEFKPQGAYRFFDTALSGLTDGIFDAQSVFHLPGRELQERLSELQDLDSKVRCLQLFLLQRLGTVIKSDPITDYAVNRIVASGGLIRVSGLSEEIGCSRRYLTGKFADYVGLSPKEYVCLVRFDRIYKSLNLNPAAARYPDGYHDQSHFIREFKRFTGFTPGEYIRRSNRLETIFSMNRQFPFIQYDTPLLC